MKWFILCIILSSRLLVQARNEEYGRIIAAYSTKTAYSITTSTTTIPLTCASAGETAVCRKRRYRRYNKLDMLPLSTEDDRIKDLTGSLEEDSDDSREKKEEEKALNREGRIAITVWTTKSSVHTVTSTSINSLTTFSISYYCTMANVGMAPACG